MCLSVADLEQLVERGVIETFTADSWGRCIGMDSDGMPGGTARTACEKIAEFEAWAEQHDTSLEPWFSHREQGSLATDHVREVVVPPIACLAAYEGDELRTVYLHAGDHGHQCVMDYVAALDPQHN